MSGYRKAVLAGLIALVGSLAVAATDNHISLAEWLVSAASSLTAVGGVYGISNSTPDDSGQAELHGVIAMALAICLGLMLWSIIGAHTTLY